MKRLTAAVFVLAAFFVNAEEGSFFQRVLRPRELTRGNINLIRRVGSIDEASWVWHPDWRNETNVVQPRFLRFRKEFVATSEKLIIDISADERFMLLCDGKFVARGPNRSIPENWQYQTYLLTLSPGRHVLEAIVWKTENFAPLAQLSWRGGFVLKASGAYDKVLTTGKTPWDVGKIEVAVPAGTSNGVWGTGAQFTFTGTGIYDAIPPRWTRAVVVRPPAGRVGNRIYGLRTNGWMLYPTELPDQMNKLVSPGKFMAVTTNAGWRANHVYTEAETEAPEVDALNRLLKEGKPFVVPPHTSIQAAWHLGQYYCAYPELEISLGKDASVAWCWTESSRNASDNLKGDRRLIVGKYLEGYGDNFISDGRKLGRFSPPWFRCGLWCRIDIKTKDEPLVIKSLKLRETRYPLEMESSFVAPEDPSLQDIRRISLRAMQMCCHEMLFDCPYYEQQMYPGDTRVQLLVLSALSRDSRAIRRAMEQYDLSQRNDGTVPFNWPSRGVQEGASYTLCYLLMYHDYIMNHNDEAFIRARLPGLRKAMAGLEYYENKQALLENLPGWLFMDWTVGWEGDGTAPGGRYGEGVNAQLNLFWSLAMRMMSLVERTLGNELQAAYWDEKRERLNKAILSAFWDEKRSLLADTPAKKDFSEHSQSLALIGDVLPADKAEKAFKHLVEDKDLKRCTVYFSYYLFEAYFKFARPDLFLKRLDLWRGYVAKGLTTTQEAPDSGKNGQIESRSDCHAWGSHPIWFMQTGLAGIKSDAPYFRRVRIEPQPGHLKKLSSRHPHPDGWIEVDFTFEDGVLKGRVNSPVPGKVVWRGKELAFTAGETKITDDTH